MKNFKLFIFGAIALMLFTSNFAMSNELTTDQLGFKVAIVDIQKVIEQSPKLNALKIERQNKLNELVAFAEKARADVEKEPDELKKKSLENGYNKELNLRKNDIDNICAQKLSAIDKEVTALIKAKAKAGNYGLVLAKSDVLDGGTDITAEIIRELK